MLLSSDVTKWGFGQVGSEFHSHLRREDLQAPLWVVNFRYEKLGGAAWVKVGKYEHTKTGWVMRTKFHGRILNNKELNWVMESVGVDWPKPTRVDTKIDE